MSAKNCKRRRRRRRKGRRRRTEEKEGDGKWEKEGEVEEVFQSEIFPEVNI